MSSKPKSNTVKVNGEHGLVPTLRFPEFCDAPAWDATPMNKLYAFMRNNAFSREMLNYDSGTAKNIHYGDIHTKFPAMFDITKASVPFVNTSIPIPPDDSEDYCQEGDLIFADASEDTNDVGKCIELVRLNDERLLSGQHTILARRKDDSLVVGFAGHLFQSARIRRQIHRESQGTKVYAISSTRLANIEVAFPTDKREQQKLAGTLTSLDELIAANAQRLDSLRAHQKALLQNLFPREGNNVPNLRFPEFRRAGAWRKRSMGHILERMSVPIRVDPRQTYREIGIRSHGKGIFHKAPVSGATLGDKRVFRVVNDAFVVNIIFAWEQAVATTTTNEEGMIASHRFPMYVAREGACDVRFINRLFLTAKGKNLLGVASPGGAGRNRTLGQLEFEKLTVLVPSGEEQRRIADAMQTGDELIAAEVAKLAALMDHKRGLMQRLFPSKVEAQQ